MKSTKRSRASKRVGPSAARSLISLALTVFAGCSATTPEPVLGSETNFLRYCSDEDCGAGLACVCGVCTEVCTDSSQCSDITSAAQCISPSVAAQGSTSSCSAVAQCEVTCDATSDCSSLGDDYHCRAGVCRTGEQSCSGFTFPQGDFTRETTINGVSRTYSVHVPPTYDNSTLTPLVLDFHAMGMTSEWQRNESGYLELSDEAGFIAVWPEGQDNTWNVGPCCGTLPDGDDFAFVTTLVRELSNEACIDQRRIYATGFSFGGAMAYYLACQHAETFAAVATSGVDLFATSEIGCDPSRPVTSIAFRNTQDTVIPYEGGLASPPGQPDVEHEFQGAVGTFKTWATLNECQGEPSATDTNGCSTYASCAADVEVTLCTTEGVEQIQGDAALAWQTLSKHQLP
jgi:polyhydroxybutyrate depolymerase